MVDEHSERVLWIWTAGELVFFVVLLGLLSASVVGETSFWPSATRRLRLGALAVVAGNLVAPLVVYYDLRRRGDETGTMWVHVAAMPLLNLIGLLAYLDYRRRDSEE